MIVGTGVDLVDVARLQAAVERWGDRFLGRVYLERELAYCSNRRDRFARLAARFAAKEAVRKALGDWWKDDLRWRSVEIVSDGTGRPEVRLSGEAAAAAARAGVEEVFLTISHEVSHAVAHVLMEGAGARGRCRLSGLAALPGFPRVACAGEMRAIDARLIRDMGVPGALLMENAGAAVARAARELLLVEERGRAAIVCGKGNNGGDGFVAARHLAEAGIEATVFLLGKAEDTRGDAKKNLGLLRPLGVRITEIKSSRGVRSAQDAWRGCGVLVDAVLGTGTSGELKGMVRSAVEAMNASGVQVVSADIPSGVDADTGRILGTAVRASRTVALGYLKRGLVLLPGAEYAGEVSLAGLGVPLEEAGGADIDLGLVTGGFVKGLLPGRPAGGHKGTFGHVLVLAGSRGLTGAAALASTAALRSGSGLVTLGIAQGLNAIMEEKLTEVMTLPLAETEGQSLAVGAELQIREFAARCDSIALGPGLSRHPETMALVKKLIGDPPCPMAVDADALTVLAGLKDVLRPRGGPAVVLTPHPGEMARMMDCGVSDVESDRIATAREAAARSGSVVVLKGARTVVADPEGGMALNPTGSEAMATGGTGDVLTGMVASLLGRGMDGYDAARAAVFAHGLAGERAAALRRADSVTASDVIELIPSVMRELRVGIGCG